jgi:hypothetical protein
MTISYIISDESITMFMNGDLHIISKGSHKNFQDIKDALKVYPHDEQAILDLINAPSQEIVDLGGGKVQVVDGQLYVGGRQIVGRLTERLILNLKEGFDVDPMVNFLTNLLENPSKRAVDELYSWMEACDMPITPDGHLLAFKRIRQNWKDIRTNSMDNSIGKFVSLPRNMVDEDQTVTCSQGLHFCSMGYLDFYSSSHPETDRVVVVKINPRDVVAIPVDYQNQKGRCCLYEVIEEIPRDNLKFYHTSVHDFNEDDEEDFYGSPDDEDDDLGEAPSWDRFENESEPSAQISSQDAMRILGAEIDAPEIKVDDGDSTDSILNEFQGMVISRFAAMALTGVDDATFDQWLAEGKWFKATDNYNLVSVL